MQRNSEAPGLICASPVSPKHGQLLSDLFWLLDASVRPPLVFSQNTKQIALVGVSWHQGLPAHLYAGGLWFTHEHLSPGPKSGWAVWAGGWHWAGLLPAGALSRLVFFLGGGDVLLFGSTSSAAVSSPAMDP